MRLLQILINKICHKFWQILELIIDVYEKKARKDLEACGAIFDDNGNLVKPARYSFFINI